MSRLGDLLRRLLRGGPAEGAAPGPVRRSVPGYLSFAHTGEVIQAERLLKAGGFPVEVKGPPPSMRTGCDMVLATDMMHASAVTRLLEEHGLSPLRFLPAGDSLLEPVSLTRTTDLGRWTMVRAANMKITFEKDSGVIVNVSGGGCPDVPYLAGLLVGRSIGGPLEPRRHGQTLCSYALQLAFEEARRQWNG